MYSPRHFEETDPAKLHGLIKEYSLATLVAVTSDRLEANHIPFHLDARVSPNGVLYGHIARANPLFKQAASIQGEALAIFQGPEAYLSPSWYAEKEKSGQVVPTWNYAVVHVYGTLRFVSDPDWLLTRLNELTDDNEAAFSKPWQVADAPEDYVRKMLSAIVGVEIQVSRMIGKWKISQNKPQEDRERIANGLTAAGNSAMALLVEPD